MARIPRKTKKVSLYLTDRQYEAMFERASLIGVGMSVMISLAINTYIENDNLYIPTKEEMRQMKMSEIKPKDA